MRYLTLPLALLLLGVAGHAGAQAPPTQPPAKVAAPLTLAQALATLPPPAKGVLLAVGADKVALPDGTLPPAADASVTTLANTFGDETQEFGPVTAIAPFTRVLLNPDPSPPDSSATMDPDTAFHLLAASLNDAQWKMLTSAGGLGLPDLTDDTQRSFFYALFPHGQLWVASQDPVQASLPDSQPTDTRNVSDQIDGVRVRLGQTAEMTLHDRKGKSLFVEAPPADSSRLYTWQAKDRASTANNILLRAVVPNSPKSSDLPFDDAKFQPSVVLTGAKTVGDLVARIAAKTHTELYADPHYASRLLTVIGPAPEAPAGEVLRALALAVAGTYRQVGPAYVLTDDREGVGTRRRRLANWSHGSNDASRRLGEQAGLTLLKRRAAQVRSLSGFGDPLAVTAEQLKNFKDTEGMPGVPDGNRNIPFADLTPAQQNGMRQIADAYQKRQEIKAANGKIDEVPREPDPSGPAGLSLEYKVQFLVPTVQKPVETEMQSEMFDLFWPGHETYSVLVAEAAKINPPKNQPPVPPLLPLLRSRPRRAVIGHPATPAAVDALVAAMQKIGLNELWLDVFSEGKSHLAAKGTDILTEALKQTSGTGITVYADLSLLTWGYAPPKDIWDLDILGQNSHFFADYDGEGLRYPAVPPPVSVSPVSATVKKTLTEMVRGVASRSGLAGFVWEESEQGKVSDYAPTLDLGYTQAMRLAFLRAFHADPVDITDTWYNEDLSLPTFDDSTADTALTKQWSEARLGANALLLTELRQAVPVSAEKPILMERFQSYPHALTTWDDPRQMPPALPPPPGSAVGVKQGRSALVRVTVTDAADTDALARSLQTLLPDPARDKADGDGYVLDFDNPHVTDGTDPLRDLVRAALPK